jgi:hypothetical protein
MNFFQKKDFFRDNHPAKIFSSGRNENGYRKILKNLTLAGTLNGYRLYALIMTPAVDGRAPMGKLYCKSFRLNIAQDIGCRQTCKPPIHTVRIPGPLSQDKLTTCPTVATNPFGLN